MCFEEFLLGCSVVLLSAHLTLTFHSKEEIPARESLIIFIESFDGNTSEHLRYKAQWRGGKFKVYSKEPIVMIIGGVGLFFPIGSITNPLLTGLLDRLTDLAPRQVQICIDLSEVISLYLTLGLLVYVAHQALHKWRKKEY